MNRSFALGAIIAVSAISLCPVAASAQSRSLVPAETLEVMLQRQDLMFNRMDLNHDGAISSTEIQTMIAQARAGGGQGGGQGGGMGGMMMMFGGPPPGGVTGGAPGAAPGGAPASGGPGGPGGPEGGPRVRLEPAQIAQRMIQASDTDADGQISRAEMRASTEQRFKAMDRNGDGILSDDERPRMRFQGGSGGQPGGGGQGPVIIPQGDGGF